MSKAERSSRLEFLPLILSMLLVCFSASNAHAFQQGQSGERGMISARAVVNFLELARKEAENPPRLERRVVRFMPTPEGPASPTGAPAPPPVAPAPDPTPRPAVPSPSPVASFAALGDNNTTIPPDTMGIVGPNHLMVALNSQVRIQNKSGGTISTVTLDFFWSSLAGVTGVFDPKLAYDPFQNRYIFSAVSNDHSASSAVLIGVTQTNDPTGTWNLFKVDADAGNLNWADYPSLGFNKDWIVVTVNMFTITSDAFVQSQIYAFNKSDLFSNAVSPAVTVFTDSSGTFAPAVTFDNTLTTMHLVQHWNANFMGSGFLRLSTITGMVNSPSFTAGTFFASTANTWSFSPSGGLDFAPQSGSAVKIQNNDSRMLAVVFRNGSLWCSQTVFLPAGPSPTRAAAQWWQLSTTGTVQQFGRVDDGTGTNFFAFPTLAVNAANDVLLGYSCFSASTFASACYSFRAGTDAANTLRDNALMKAGEGIYHKTFGAGQNRWGDYSNTAVDPVDDQTMWTIQEYAATPVSTGDGSGRWGTWWAKIPGSKKRRGQVTSQ